MEIQGWDSFPSYLDTVVPRILDFLDERGLKITFFIVGQDAALTKNYTAIRSIAEAGHEIGNHSFNHEAWLHLYTAEQFEKDLVQTEEHIQRVTGQKPVGFRGPGYSLSSTVLRVLSQHGYLYDASTLPTFIGPLARAYYFMTTKLSQDEHEHRKLLFGSFRDGFKPLCPYQWQIDGKKIGLLEISVTTLPIFKIPFHVSYIMYIRCYSRMLAKTYFQSAIKLCQITHTYPSLLLHPLDFLGSDDIKELSFFPAMNLDRKKKIHLVDEILRVYTDRFKIVSLGEYVHTIMPEKNLATFEFNFS